MSKKFKKALRLAAVMGCGFEGDAEDAAELLSLITFHESRIAELEATVEVGADIAKAYENRVSEIVALSNETVGKLNSRIAELETDNAEFRQLIRDWSIVLEQNNGFWLWQVESVRQAMLEINKEREE